MLKNNKNRKSKFRILSIDGGGSKGYFTTYAIYKLNEDFGINILDHFDMVVGTSTGALISAALLKGIVPKDIHNQYEYNQDMMFQREGLINSFRSKLFAQYNNTPLIEFLDELYGEMTLEDLYEDAKKPFLFFAANYNEGKPVLFGSPNFKNVNPRYQRFKLKEVLQASSAAPMFFEPLIEKYTDDWIIDGGIWANNPSMASFLMALSEFDVDHREIEIMSFGQTFMEDQNFKPVKGVTLKNNEFSGLYYALMNTNMNFANYSMYSILKERFFRYSPNTKFHDLSLAQINEDFKKYSRNYYEENKYDLVEFIESGNNKTYSDNLKKRYN